VRRVITSPGAAFAELAEAQPWRQGVALYALVTLAQGAVALLNPAMPRSGSAPLQDLLASPWFALISAMIFGPIVFLLAIVLLHQMALRQGGSGSFVRFFSTEIFKSVAVGLVAAPLLIAAYLIVRATGNRQPNLITLTSIVIGIWQLVLTVYSLRASMRLSRGGAIITIIISVIVAALIAGFGLLFLSIAFAR